VTLSRKGAKSQTRVSGLRSTGTKARTRGRRTRESRADLEKKLAEALEQQTATSEVLKVISSSAFELQPVLENLLKDAVRLCDADKGFIYRQDGEVYRIAASYGHSPEFIEIVKRNPIRKDRGSATGRAILERRVVHIHDILADPDYRWAEDYRGVEEMHRTILAVPLLREDAIIGVIIIRRTRVQPFTDKQIELVTNFAAQAVIAIENTRLLNELRQRTDDLTEALEQQTATSEVLGVISSSPGELGPTFEAILANAVRICDASFGNLLLSEGSAFRVAAMHGAPLAWDELRRRDPVIRFGPKSPLARIAATRHLEHIADVREEEAYLERDQTVVTFAELTGARTSLAAPMLKENRLIGAIAIYRQEVRPSSRSSW
jgi:GAF domain-containing protein